ncbi:methyl-accepting chemotaxis protein [Velocimicrobium porci]|uniref:HAMP domain-containing protein n=1 Tax=Velocimicrobium porci TaxID=2606634 RepID=A0A6L5XW79_9FIRM|nr:methyl-accepting chemotaxis protein [Velocimicrobium porci]MSS62681.1 HAMP domain-containing protein [Velocimicrobium porci]
MKSFKDLKIKTKLIIGFNIVIVAIVFLAICSLKMIYITNTAGEKRFTTYGTSSGDVALAFVNYQEIKVHLRNLLYVEKDGSASEASEIEQINECSEYMGQYLNKFYKEVKDDQVLSVFKESQASLINFQDTVDKVIALVQENKYDEARLTLEEEGAEVAKTTEGAIDDIITMLDKRADEKAKELQGDVGWLVILMIFVAFIGILISVIFEIVIVRSIRIPLKKLKKVSESLAVGDVQITVQKESDDEFGELMDEFKIMIDNIRKQAMIAEQIAKGDMCIEVQPNSEKDILGYALKKIVDDNNRVLGNIKEASMQVTSGSGQVASASQSLAQGSTEQASAIEQVSASIEDIAERTRVNATDANEANRLVNETKEDAVKGNEQMNEMIHAMEEINESSENISKIIKVIDDIAFQTNILALNAAVEAARAGTHGKGFAVVAEEVRNLAGKSALAASETAEMIEDSIKKVENGSKLAQETAVALNHIVAAVDNIVDLINGIAGASNEQATAVAQIDQALAQVSQVVQTNSATSEQCAAASEELSNQAVRLRELISIFNLKELNSNSYMGNVYNNMNGSEEWKEPIISLEDDELEQQGSKEITTSIDNGFGKY